MKTVVRLDKVERQLRRLPRRITLKLNLWIKAVEMYGLRQVRVVAGYHDEPLQGVRFGQRSIRLNRAYRMIYTEHKHGDVHLVIVEKVSKHEY